MDERYRGLLDKNRILLLKNLVLTDDFYDLLEKEKVLPQSMIADVKEEGLTREERSARLLNALLLRTSAAFRRFRRVLLATGHCFLADVLWDEDLGSSNIEDTLASRFPALFDRIPDDIRRKLATCIETMVREKTLVSSWQTNPSDRLEVIQARASDFKQERHLRQTIDTLHKQVQTLQVELETKNNQICSLDIEVQTLNKEVERLHQEHLADIEKQANFNTANSKSIIRLKERFDMVNSNIANVNRQLKVFLGEDGDQSESDPDNVKVTLLERNLHRLMELAKNGRRREASVDDDKDAVCVLLNMKKAKYCDKSVSDIIKAHLNKEEKGKKNLLKEIEKLSEVLSRDIPSFSNNKGTQTTEKTDFRFLTMQVAMIHAHLEHLYKKMVWKDTEIDTLKSELQTMTKNLSNVKSKPRTRLPSPDMTREMKVAYANVNEYLKEDKLETMSSPGSLPVRNVPRVLPSPDKPLSQGGSRRQIRIPLVKNYDARPTEV